MILALAFPLSKPTANSHQLEKFSQEICRGLQNSCCSQRNILCSLFIKNYQLYGFTFTDLLIHF